MALAARNSPLAGDRARAAAGVVAHPVFLAARVGFIGDKNDSPEKRPFSPPRRKGRKDF